MQINAHRVIDYEVYKHHCLLQSGIPCTLHIKLTNSLIYLKKTDIRVSISTVSDLDS